MRSSSPIVHGTSNTASYCILIQACCCLYKLKRKRWRCLKSPHICHVCPTKYTMEIHRRLTMTLEPARKKFFSQLQVWMIECNFWYVSFILALLMQFVVVILDRRGHGDYDIVCSLLSGWKLAGLILLKRYPYIRSHDPVKRHKEDCSVSQGRWKLFWLRCVFLCGDNCTTSWNVISQYIMYTFRGGRCKFIAIRMSPIRGLSQLVLCEQQKSY